MNLSFKITQAIDEASISLIAAVVYTRICSDVKVRGMDVVSMYAEDDVYDEYADCAKVVLSSLEEAGLLFLNKGKIIVGMMRGSNPCLFEQKTKTTNYFGEQLNILLKQYEESVRDSRKYSAYQACASELSRLGEYDSSSIDAKFVLRYYAYVYEAIYQEAHRDFSGKEVGQAKSVVKYFSTVDIRSAIIAYLSWADVPSLGHLLACKDPVIRKVSSVSKSLTTNDERNRKQESDF